MTHERAQVLVEALQRAVLEGVHEFEGEPDRIRVDLGLVPVFADERPLQGLAGLMDWRRSGWLSSLLRSGFCSGRVGERVLMPGGSGLPVERVVLVGLGPRADFDAEAAQRAARDLVRVALGIGAPRVLVALPAHAERRPAELLFSALTEAIDQAEQEWEARHPAVAAAVVARGVIEPSGPVEGEERPVLGAAADDTSTRPQREGPPDGDPEPGITTPGITTPGITTAAPGDPDTASPAETTPASAPESPEIPPEPDPPRMWWVVADERVVARLRRVLSGPPRATPGGLHT